MKIVSNISIYLISFSLLKIMATEKEEGKPKSLGKRFTALFGPYARSPIQGVFLILTGVVFAMALPLFV